jgi:hypothetical protein
MGKSATEASLPTPMAADIGRMSVDRLIQELRDHGYTGEYILHHVIKGVDKASGEMPTLFNQVKALYQQEYASCTSNVSGALPVHGGTPGIGYE